tara:strand:- start:252 stop:482 length:231 start_codon:yes stop_codon:yes gene_type:complete
MAFKMKGPMFFRSAIKNRVTEGGKLVDHTHEDGSTHTYAETVTRKDGTVAPGGTDEKGTIKPAPKPAPKMYDKKKK